MWHIRKVHFPVWHLKVWLIARKVEKTCEEGKLIIFVWNKPQLTGKRIKTRKKTRHLKKNEEKHCGSYSFQAKDVNSLLPKCITCVEQLTNLTGDTGQRGAWKPNNSSEKSGTNLAYSLNQRHHDWLKVQQGSANEAYSKAIYYVLILASSLVRHWHKIF